MVRPRPTTTKSGFLRLNVTGGGYAKVYVDGAYIGTTPIVRYKVKAGRRRISLVTSSKRKVVYIKVPPKGTVTKLFNKELHVLR